MQLNQQNGCLLIHGFGGGLYEIDPLVQHLESLGYIVSAPLLGGHGATLKENKEQLRKIDYHQWLNEAQDAYHELNKLTPHIIVIGFSMGGLIGLQLATTLSIKSLILLNTPIFPWDFKNIMRNLLNDLRCKRTTHLRHYLNSGGKLPLNAMLQFRNLLFSTKKHLNRVECPLYTIQTNDDDSVQPRSQYYLIKHTRSKQKKSSRLKTGGHLVLLSQSSESVCHLISDYLESF